MEQIEKTTLFIGCGNMGLAIVKGFRKSGGNMNNVSVVDPFLETESAVELGFGGLYRRLADVPQDQMFDRVVLAVKPQIFETLDAQWIDHLAHDGMVISIMAGVESKRLGNGLSTAQSVVRCMPNMAAAVGYSVNVVYISDQSRKPDFESLFRGSGPVQWVASEDEIHMTTAISGSGPAYFFAFVEALAQAGEKAGLETGFSLNLAMDTMIGAAELLKSNRDPASLRESVTSKGGTTAAALEALGHHDNLNAVVADGVSAAITRSRELAG